LSEKCLTGEQNRSLHKKDVFMRNTNISKLDSKGRILIPAYIRSFLNVDEGTEIIILPDNEKSGARILPLVKDKTAELRITMADSPGSLAVIADILAKYNINVLMSKTRAVVKGKVAEWDMIVDTSKCNGKIERMRSNLLGSNLIKNMEIVRV
jgi:AbrB family looped-hinge helix DNA binding protein